MQSDLEHDLARARRPAKPFLSRFKPFQKTTHPHHHIRQSRPQIIHRIRDPFARIAWPLANACIRQEAAPIDARQETIPILGHARPHLGALEILTQLLARLHKAHLEEGLAIRPFAARKAGQRRLGQIDPHLAPLARIICNAPLAPYRVLRGKRGGGLGHLHHRMAALAVLLDQGLEGGFANRGDPIACHPAPFGGRDPILERKSIGDIALQHGCAGLRPVWRGPQHNRLVHIARNDKNGVFLT